MSAFSASTLLDPAFPCTHKTRDSYNLGWKLAGVIKQELQPTVLDTYELERRPIAHELLDVDRILFQFFHPDQYCDENRSEDSARVVRFLSGLLIQYPPSTLTIHQREVCPLGQLTAGMRAPDVEVWRISDPLAASLSTSLLTLLRSDGRFHLLVFVDRLDRFIASEAVLRRLLPPSSGEWNVLPLCVTRPDPADLDPRVPVYCLAEAEGTCTLAPKAPAVAVVRPDQYIGWCGDLGDTKGLEKYLRRIFL